MKATAVEWLEERFLQTEGNLYEEDFVKAKEMEKQQIINAYADGRISVIDREIISYEQYYNEKFKTKSYERKNN